MGLTRITNNITNRLNHVIDGLAAVPDSAHQYFVAATPIDTGNARDSTDLVGNQIQANYNYANALNTGWSRQAPDGMTGQTIEHIRNQIKKI